MDEPFLVFVHIQKTAGYSLRKILLREYGGRRHVTHLPNVFTRGEQSHEEVAAIASRPPPGVRVVHGHIMFWPDIPWPSNARFFTMIRDPVDRAISHFDWLQERSDSFSRKTDLQDALHGGLIPDNLQTRVLAANTAPFGELPAAALDEAITNLDRFSVVGLTHRFDESLVLLSREFGWRRVIYERLNVTARRTPREAVPPETVELIRHLNALDAKLYLHACERFERDVAKQGDGFPIEVAVLKAANMRFAEFTDGSVLDAQLPAITNGLPPGPIDAEKLLVDTQAELLVREEVRLAVSARRTQLERQRETSTKRAASLRRKLDQRGRRNKQLTEHAAKLAAELHDLRRRMHMKKLAAAPRAPHRDSQNESVNGDQEPGGESGADSGSQAAEPRVAKDAQRRAAKKARLAKQPRAAKKPDTASKPRAKKTATRPERSTP